MKNWLLVLLLIVSCFSYGQYPSGIQTIGTDSNLVQAKGGFKARTIIWSFADTAAANLQRIKGYPFALISTNNNKLWLRDFYAKKWMDVGSSGGGGTNIYNSDGTLTSTRVLDGAGFDLTINNVANLSLIGTGLATLGTSLSNRFEATTGLGANLSINSPDVLLPQVPLYTSSAAKGLVIDSNTKKIYYTPKPATQSALNDTAAAIRADTTIYAGGLIKQNDTAFLGGYLTYGTHTLIGRHSLKRPELNKAFFITNDTTIPNPLRSTTNRTLFAVQSDFWDSRGDTLSVNYDQVMAVNRTIYNDQFTNRWGTSSTWKPLTRAGILAQVNHFLPESTTWSAPGIGSNGSGSPLVSFIGLGNTWGYDLKLLESDYYTKIPLSTALADFDLDKTGAQNLDKKRSVTGGYGLAGYTSLQRSIQRVIDNNVVKAGSYYNRITDFYALGALPMLTSTATSKDSVLAYQTIDTAIAFFAAPKRLPLNEVKNGYGFVQTGDEDFNYFAGKTRMGNLGGWPTRSVNQNSLLLLADTAHIVSSSGYNAALHVYRNESLYSEEGQFEKKGVESHINIAFKDNYTKVNQGNHWGVSGVLQYYDNNLNDTIMRGANGHNRISAAVHGRIRFQGTGPGDSATYSITNNVLSPFFSRFDFAASTILNKLTILGKTANFYSQNDWDGISGGNLTFHSHIDIGSYKATSGLGVTQLNGLYVRPLATPQVSKAYSIYLEGTADTAYIGGKLKMPNVTAGAGVKALRIDANGNVLAADTSTANGTVSVGNANTLAVYAANGNVIQSLAPITPSMALASSTGGLPIASNISWNELHQLSGIQNNIQFTFDDIFRKIGINTVNVGNVNFSANAGDVLHLPSGTLTSNKTIDLSALTINGDYLEIYCHENNGFTWSFAGQPVYQLDRATTVTTLTNNTCYKIRRVAGLLIINN